MEFAEGFELWCKYYDPEQLELNTLLKLCDLRDKVVLEIGCGTGRMTFQLAPYVRKCIGIDINPQMIDFCKRKLKKYSFDNIEFKVGDGQNLDFPDNSFDVVLFV